MYQAVTGASADPDSHDSELEEQAVGVIDKYYAMREVILEGNYCKNTLKSLSRSLQMPAYILQLSTNVVFKIFSSQYFRHLYIYQEILYYS